MRDGAARWESCPRLDSRLLRQLDDGRKAKDEEEEEVLMVKDFYEYEEGVAEEETGKNKRYDSVEHVEYELPSDFEDEEIDEDAAFGEEDIGLEENIKTKRREDISLDESDVSLNSDEEDPASAEEDDEESGDEDEEDEEDEEEEEDDDEKHQQMLEAVTGKPHQLRNDDTATERKRDVRSEAFSESEFNLNSNVHGNSSSITVADLLGGLEGASGLGALRKNLQPLENENLAISAPLPKVIQERMERKAGYDKSREEVTKWEPLVKQNREAPSIRFNERTTVATTTVAGLAAKHTPVTDMEREVAAILEQSNMGITKDIEAAEALELNKLSVEEVKERQQRLSKMRSLLFQHEAKAKRVAKIKSKTFHRLDKSKRMRDFMETDEEAAKEAALKQEQKRAEERMTLKHKNTSRWAKRIIKRGLKAHEDGTRDAIMEQLRAHSMLTKKIQSAGFSDSEESSSSSSEEEEDDKEGTSTTKGKSRLLAKAKAATLEALQFDDEAEVPQTGLFALPFMARAIEKKRNEAREEALAILEQLEQAEADEGADGGGADHEDRRNKIEEAGHSGRLAFGDLAVSSKAENVKRSKTKRNSDDYSDLELDKEDNDDDSDGVSEEDDTKKRRFQMHPAKKAFSKSEAKSSIDDKSQSSSDPTKSSKESSLPEESSRKRKKRNKKNKGPQTTASENSDQVDCTKDTSAASEPAGKQNNKKKKKTDSTHPTTGSESLQGKDPQTNTSGVIQVSVFNMKTGFQSSISAAANPSAAATPDKDTEVGKPKLGQATSFLDLDDDDDAPTNNGLELLGKGTSQQDLIRQAFAGDDVEADFQDAKARVLGQETVQVEESKTLPGWGQWSHIQKKRVQSSWKEDLEKKRREEAIKKRQDAKLKFVVISEKTDKKAAKYHTSTVPFPMKTKEVFEQSLRMPIGREYNGEKVFRDMIRPAELKSAGVIIDPIKLNKSAKRPADAPEPQKGKKRRGRPEKK